MYKLVAVVSDVISLLCLQREKLQRRN